MRDRSLPGKVEFGLNSEFIPCLVLVLFGQKCTPIAHFLLVMKSSAVSGCAYLVPHKRKHLCQNELQLVGFIAPSFCFLLPTFSSFFKYDPCHFLWVYRAKTYFRKCTTMFQAFFSPVLACTGEVRLWMQCWFMFGKTRLRSGKREVAYGKPKFAEAT